MEEMFLIYHLTLLKRNLYNIVAETLFVSVGIWTVPFIYS